MTRPLRLLVENGHYHVTSRSWDRSALFPTDAHRAQFLDTVALTMRIGYPFITVGVSFFVGG